MGFFNDLSVNTKTCAKKLSLRADSCIEMKKLKLSEGRILDDISKRLKFLGARVYKLSKSGEISGSGLAEDIAAVDDLYDDLASVRARIDALKSVSYCPVCGAANTLGGEVCCFCGAKPEQEE